MLPRLDEVDPRFQPYDVEVVEVTGGRFWRPYGPETFAALENPETAAAAATPEELAATPSGVNPAPDEYRPPLDLGSERLRTLAAALAPAYMRVSGTWANTTWFADTGESPEGYSAVLTHDQWRGVIDVSNAVDAGIVDDGSGHLAPFPGTGGAGRSQSGTTGDPRPAPGPGAPRRG